MQPGHGFRTHSRVVRVMAITLVSALALTALAIAQEWPSLRQGMWEITRTMQAPGGGAPKTVTAKRCMDPAADWQKQNAQLTKAGCTFTPIKHSGGTYTFSSSCNVAGMSSTTTTTIVVESDSSYTLTVEGTTDGAPTHEVMKARRVGDCAK